MADAPFTFLPLGAVIQTFKVNGINIVQGFPTQDQYAKYNSPYFGETVGRVANRLKGAQLDSLNGKTYTLAANDAPNSLHGGVVGWGKRVWEGPTPVGIRDVPGVDGLQGGESVAFTLTSEDGDQGYPGTVEATVVYTTGTQTVDGKEAVVLGIDYEVKLVDGADETAVNLTNHSYFNLTGDETTDGTTVTLATNQYLPVDAGSIPTAGPTAFPLAVHEPFVLAPTGTDVDHCFTTTTEPSAVPIDTRSSPLLLNLAAHHPKTGIHLQVLSTEPAFQFYTGTGASMNVPAVDGAPARGVRSGFCLEPSRWVNAINVPEWKNQSLLKKGETYGARIVYKAWSD